MLSNLDRLSLNQITTQRWSVRDAVEGCVRHGIPYIGLWRDKVAETGLQESVRIVRDAGLKVSSLCRGGWFPAATKAERQARIDDNRRAIDEAVALGTNVLVLVCGPAPDRDIRAARGMVEDAIATLIPYATDAGVKLGIEPLHPMFAADRSVIVTLSEATRLAKRFKTAQVGVVVDVYHVWWDPDVYDHIAQANGMILGFHVSDWSVPFSDTLKGRAMMGDGVIELRSLRHAVEQSGYDGPIEVEILNEAIWDTPGDQTLEVMCKRYLEHV